MIRRSAVSVLDAIASVLAHLASRIEGPPLDPIDQERREAESRWM